MRTDEQGAHGKCSYYVQLWWGRLDENGKFETDETQQAHNGWLSISEAMEYAEGIMDGKTFESMDAGEACMVAVCSSAHHQIYVWMREGSGEWRRV
jgi:hypothetical protein